MTRRPLILLALSLFALSALSPSADAARKRSKSPRLKAFSSCSSLISYGNRFASRQAVFVWRAPRGQRAPSPMSGGGEAGGGSTDGGGGTGGPVSEQAPAAAPAPAAGTDFSGTNTQEESVDEPDIVKTDGSTVFAIANQRLNAVDVRGGTSRLAGSLTLPDGAWSAELLISGGRALVMWTRYTYGGASMAVSDRAAAASVPGYGGGSEETVLAEVDISDPAAMKIVRTMSIEGRLVSSRLNGTTARVITAATPRALEVPIESGSSLAQQRRAVRRAGSRRAARWLPRRVARRGTKGRPRARAAVACRATRRPATFSGLDMVTVTTIDLAKGLTPVDSDALMTDAETVYASERSLYIATRRWLRAVDSPLPVGSVPEPPSITTQIHKFDISDSQNTVYRGSGSVTGYLLNQFSMSEHKGNLRVASTDGPQWWPGPTGPVSESAVTVLDERPGGVLATLGKVAGLGKGERIYAVRFIGDTGYVVTFRQTDPLYTIDASDPARPKVVGELKILGYSAYLHPVGDGLLIGVGQDATEEGRRLGAQVSLFDVSDPAKPTRLHARSLGEYAFTEAEYNHHAFLYWPATNLLMLPINVYSERSSFAGAIGFRVKRETGIEEIGRVSHDAGEFPVGVQRSMVIAERVYTMSELGLKGSMLDTLADASWVGFPGRSGG